MLTMYDLIIIGAGPAGLFAATCAAMNKLNALVIESSTEFGGQLTLYKEKSVYDMPAFAKVNTEDLLKSLYHQYMQYKDEVGFQLNTTATNLKKVDDYFVLSTTQGDLKSKTILLANGGGIFKARKLGIDLEDQMSNIEYHVKDLNSLKDLKVVILGGGDSAVDWALALKDVAKSVTVIHRRDEFRAHLHNVLLLKDQAKLYTPYKVLELIGTNYATHLRIKHLETNEEVLVEADKILVFYGNQPIKGKLDPWEVEIKDNLIKVKSDMRTSREGIYAVGNSVTYEGKLRMIVTALGEAATAVGAITKYLHPERTYKYKH
jgi:ferredoxin/flavodoxin---NADP+ reductase